MVGTICHTVLRGGNAQFSVVMFTLYSFGGSLQWPGTCAESQTLFYLGGDSLFLNNILKLNCI